MTSAISACSRERPVRFVAQKGSVIRARGLHILFAAGENRLFYHQLRAGRLKLADLPGRLELQQIRKDGCKVLGQVTYDAEGRFFVAGRPAADKKGPIIAAPGKYRFVSAESLFPVLGRQRHENYYFDDGRAFVVYGGRHYMIPVDSNARFGPAARERRISFLAVPETGRLHFFEAQADREERHIGSMPIDAPATGRNRSVWVTDHIEAFNLKDQPVRIGGDYARLDHRGVTLSFRTERRNLHYADLIGRRLFLRTGYADRIEVVRKTDGEERVLGAIRIEADCLVVGEKRIPLDRTAGPQVTLKVEAAIEELGGREVVIRPGRRRPYAAFKAFEVNFFFPMSVGNVYLGKLKAGRIVARVYESRIEIGHKEKGTFHEIGRVGTGVLRGVQKGGWVNLAKLIPDVGRTEKRLGPKPTKFKSRGVDLYCNQRPGEPYHADFRARRLFFRAIGGRWELFADRGGQKEFIGTAPNRRDKGESFDRLFPVLKADKNWDESVCRALQLKDHYALETFLSAGGPQLNLLKRLALFAGRYFAGTKIAEDLAGKLLFLLARGAEMLRAERSALSADLRRAFADEIVATMRSAFTDQALDEKRTAWRENYELALVAAAGIGSLPDRPEAAEPVPVLRHNELKQIRLLEEELTARSPAGQEQYFLAEGRYLKWLAELTRFGRSYFFGGGKWALSLMIDYYSLMYKAICLFNNSAGFEDQRSHSVWARQRDALVVPAAAVLVELEHQPQADSYYFEVLTRKGAALSGALTLDQKVQLVSSEEKLLARLGRGYSAAAKGLKSPA
jgi:hypothetical protein